MAKKLKLSQLEKKLNNDLENELINHWKEFHEIVLDDSEKPFKYKKVDVCQCIKNWLKTGKPELSDEIEIPSNDFLKEQVEKMWNNGRLLWKIYKIEDISHENKK